MPSVLRIIYYSESQLDPDPQAVCQGLDEILETARRKNAEAGVSGALIYAHGQFMQLLEGPNDPVDEVYANIVEDARHSNVTLVRRAYTDRRLFPRWPMAFLADTELQSALKQSGMNKALDISQMPVDMVAGFLGNIMAPETPPGHKAAVERIAHQVLV